MRVHQVPKVHLFQKISYRGIIFSQTKSLELPFICFDKNIDDERLWREDTSMWGNVMVCGIPLLSRRLKEDFFERGFLRFRKSRSSPVAFETSLNHLASNIDITVSLLSKRKLNFGGKYDPLLLGGS